MASPVVRGRYIRRGVVKVTGAGFSPGASITIEVDPAWPHASIACNAARTRTIETDGAGRFSLVVTARGECALACDRYRVFVDGAAGDELATSRAFTCLR